MTKSFYVYLSSIDSKHIFPHNTSTDFTIQLPERITLEGNNWQCGLIELTVPPDVTEGPAYFCCDICTESIVGGKQLPVLRQVHAVITQPNCVTYALVRTTEFITIRLQIRDNKGTVVLPDPGVTSCVLHFIQP